MKQPYRSPRLTDYGNLLAVTGVTGVPGFNDVQFYVSSSFVARGIHSLNICPPPLQESDCIA